MKITMIGTGYVGLVSGACFAEVGNDVVCFDVDPRKIDALKGGECPIHEPGLPELVERNAAAGRLRFTTESSRERGARARAVHRRRHAARRGRVGRPQARRRGRAHDRAAHDRAPLVVDKITVPVGTADAVREAIGGELAARGASIPFEVVSNPEFLKEGAAVDDFMKPDRVVIGTDDAERATRVMRDALRPVPAQPRPADRDGRRGRPS